MSDWGSQGIDSFISTRHSEPYHQILPENNKLSTPYVVCVIGASRGIGAEIAYAFARAGASHLILSSRSTSNLQSIAEQCRDYSRGCQVELVSCDIASSSSVQDLAREVKERAGRLDAVIVNSAWSGPVLLDVTDGDPEIFSQVTETNYFGTYYAAHYLIPLLKETPTSGHSPKAFFAVGSNAAFIVRGPIANFQYCISKNAQLKLIEHIHEQHGTSGVSTPKILAIAVHPGAVRTQMALETSPKEFLPYLIDDPGLCGAFLTWLARPRQGPGIKWLGGRHLVAKWDVNELEAKKEEIVIKDLLKLKLSI